MMNYFFDGRNLKQLCVYLLTGLFADYINNRLSMNQSNFCYKQFRSESPCRSNPLYIVSTCLCVYRMDSYNHILLNNRS